MGIREEVLHAYEESRVAMMSQLDEVDKNRKIYPLWTIRELIAHLSGWDDAAIGFLSALINNDTPPTPAMRGMDVYNAETVSTREGLSYEQVVREYMNTREKLLSLIKTSTDEILTRKATLPWGGEGTFEEIAGIFSPHEIEHANDVKMLIETEESKL